MSVDREWVSYVRLGSDGGATGSPADDWKRPSREVLTAEIMARHAGLAAETKLLGSAWTADGEDIGLIRRLYATSRRRADVGIDIPVVRDLLHRDPRRPREAAAQPIPPYLDDAVEIVTKHAAAIERLAKVLLVRNMLWGSELSYVVAKVLERTR